MIFRKTTISRARALALVSALALCGSALSPVGAFAQAAAPGMPSTLVPPALSSAQVVRATLPMALRL